MGIEPGLLAQPISAEPTELPELPYFKIFGMDGFIIGADETEKKKH